MNGDRLIDRVAAAEFTRGFGFGYWTGILTSLCVAAILIFSNYLQSA